MSLGALVRNGEETMHALCISAELLQREPNPRLSPLASPQPKEWLWHRCPYLHSLQLQINFGTNAQNGKESTSLHLSVLKILNPKGKGDLPGFEVRSEHLPTNRGRQRTLGKVQVTKEL